MAIAVYPDGLVPSTATLTLLAANDAVVLPVSGNDWATVLWTVTAAGSGAITVEYSTDAGTPTNWLTPPRSVLTSTVSANPSTAPWVNNGPVAGTYETPIPGNCTFFQIRYQTAGTATTITLKGGKRYVPGSPVSATLYDTTEGSIGAGLATGILDASGWGSVMIWFSTPTTQVWSFNSVDDAGANLTPTIATTAATAASMLLSPTSGGATTATLASTVSSSLSWGGKRFKLTLPAGGTVSTGRAIIVARR